MICIWLLALVFASFSTVTAAMDAVAAKVHVNPKPIRWGEEERALADQLIVAFSPFTLKENAQKVASPITTHNLPQYFKIIYEISYTFIYLTTINGFDKNSFLAQLDDVIDLLYVIAFDNALLSRIDQYPECATFLNSLEKFLKSCTSATLAACRKEAMSQQLLLDIFGSINSAKSLAQALLKSYSDELLRSFPQQVQFETMRQVPKLKEKWEATAAQEKSYTTLAEKAQTPQQRAKMGGRAQKASKEAIAAKKQYDDLVMSMKSNPVLGNALQSFRTATRFLVNNRGCQKIKGLGRLTEEQIITIFSVLERNDSFEKMLIKALGQLDRSDPRLPDDIFLTLQTYITVAYVHNPNQKIRGKTRGSRWELIVALYCLNNKLVLRRMNIHIEKAHLLSHEHKEFDIILEEEWADCKNRKWSELGEADLTKTREQAEAQKRITYSHNKHNAKKTYYLISRYPCDTLNAKHIECIDEKTVKSIPKLSKFSNLYSSEYIDLLKDLET